MAKPIQSDKGEKDKELECASRNKIVFRNAKHMREEI